MTDSVDICAFGGAVVSALKLTLSIILAVEGYLQAAAAQMKGLRLGSFRQAVTDGLSRKDSQLRPSHTSAGEFPGAHASQVARQLRAPGPSSPLDGRLKFTGVISSCDLNFSGDCHV